MNARIIMPLVVEEREELAPDIVRLRLRHKLKPQLPAWTPGAHVDIRLPDGKTRQYSLTSDPADLSCYAITVKREPGGRGGSAWVHDTLTEGQVAHTSKPRNNFPLSDDRADTVLIAGGIGVTPILSMAQHLAETGRLLEAHLCERARPSPFEADLRAVAGDALTMHVTSDGPDARLDVDALVKRLPRDVHIYCCGPDRLVRAVEAATSDWPEEQIHFELFAPAFDENYVAEPFDLTIAATGQTLHVPADRSALDVLREAGHVLPSSCELGVCGSCVCEYTDGDVVHRDSILRQSARKHRLALCVSRARGGLTISI